MTDDGKPLLRIALLRAPGHGGRTLLHLLRGGRAGTDGIVVVDGPTRRYQISLGMPEDAAFDELPVHGALLVVRSPEGVVRGTRRALGHAQHRGVRRVLLCINAPDVAALAAADDVERGAREALYQHGFAGDEAGVVHGFDRAMLLEALDAHLPYFELGQELLPQLMHVLRLVEHGPQEYESLLRDSGWRRRPFPRLFAALVDAGVVRLDDEALVELTDAGRDALDDPELLRPAAAQAARAPLAIDWPGGEMWGYLRLRRGRDNSGRVELGAVDTLFDALARLLGTLPLSTSAQDAVDATLALLRRDEDELGHGARTDAWRELPGVPLLVRALAEVEDLHRRAPWLFRHLRVDVDSAFGLLGFLRAGDDRVYYDVIGYY